MASQRSAQVTVTTAGTSVAGPNLVGNVFHITALSGNAGVVYVGPGDGLDDVDSTNGHELSPGASTVAQCDSGNASELRFDAAGNGYKVSVFRQA